jgi:hypothetical protein
LLFAISKTLRYEKSEIALIFAFLLLYLEKINLGMNSRFFFYICSFLLVFTACKKPKPSQALNATEISKLMEITQNHTMSIEEKYYTLVESYAQVLQEALSKTSDEEMLAHLRTYRSQNGDALIRLEEEFDAWQKNMADEERMYFVVNLVSKPATQSLNYLAPRAESRFVKHPEDYKELKRMLMRMDLRR